MGSKEIIGLGVWLAFVVTALLSVTEVVDLGSKLNRMVTYQGEVFRFERQVPIIEFKTEGDRYLKLPVYGDHQPVQHRQKVNVLYDPTSPRVVRLGTTDLYYSPGIYLAITLLLGFAAFFLAPPAELIRNITTTPEQRAAEAMKRAEAAAAAMKSRPEGSDGFQEPVRSKKVDKVEIDFDPKSSFKELQPFIDDPEVSDIIVRNYRDIIARKGSKLVKASTTFSGDKAYQTYVDRLLLVAGTDYSVAKPIADGMITSSIRIHAVHPVLCEDGPYVTLRVNRYRSIKPDELTNTGLAPNEVLTYLSALIHSGQTVLCAGEVGTGKTTLVRALASRISKDDSILVIEDTPEIQIDHPYVRYLRTRESNVAGKGRVRPSECIRAGMRMAMNRIIFGEIRDPEAAEAFIDVCVSGHPGLSTVHSRSAVDAIARLELLMSREQGGVDRKTIREQIGAAVQAIVYLKVCRLTGRRRISEVIELHPDKDAGVEVQSVFKYDISGDMPYWKRDAENSFHDEDLKRSGQAGMLSSLPQFIGLSG